MTFFYVIFSLLIVQRLLEIFVARRNEQWMIARGGMEIGAAHYPLMVLMHVGFFISLWIEVMLRDYPVSAAWKVLLAGLLVVQVTRYWAIASLGRFWNTKIMVVPGAEVVRRGPYRFLRHPNYTVVILELVIIPLLFDAYITFVTFSMLNACMLRHRIRVEEEGLSSHTAYLAAMGSRMRFLPKKPE